MQQLLIGATVIDGTGAPPQRAMQPSLLTKRGLKPWGRVTPLPGHRPPRSSIAQDRRCSQV